MKLNIYTVFDTKANAFLPPFFLPTDGMAVRTFKDAAEDEKHAFYKNAEDYILYRIGSYDDGTALLTPEKLESLGCAIMFTSRHFTS